MPIILPFHPETASATIVIDGVTYRVPLIDSDGHLQVDVVSAALATDAATATNQATMITALQLIDDLRAALDAVRTDRLNVNVYRDGASEIKSIRLRGVSPTTTRVTVLTPTPGKKIRVISYQMVSADATVIVFELYFGTGAQINTDNTKAVGEAILDVVDFPSASLAWPDGGGPVGAVNEVLSMRSTADIASDMRLVVHYREE